MELAEGDQADYSACTTAEQQLIKLIYRSAYAGRLNSHLRGYTGYTVHMK